MGALSKASEVQKGASDVLNKSNVSSFAVAQEAERLAQAVASMPETLASLVAKEAGPHIANINAVNKTTLAGVPAQVEEEVEKRVSMVDGGKSAKIAEQAALIERLQSGAPPQAGRSFMDEDDDDVPPSAASHMTIHRDEDDD
jgi:hypothetical protein